LSLHCYQIRTREDTGEQTGNPGLKNNCGRLPSLAAEQHPASAPMAAAGSG
jgi:hypothetical protein